MKSFLFSLSQKGALFLCIYLIALPCISQAKPAEAVSARSLIQLGHDYSQRKLWDSAQASWAKAISISRANEDWCNWVEAVNLWSNFQSDIEVTPKLLALQDSAILMGETHCPQNQLLIADSWAEKAGTVHKISLFRESIEYQEKALALRRAKLGDKHKLIGKCYEEMALAYEEMLDFSSAFKLYTKAEKIYASQLEEDSFERIRILIMKGTFFHKFQNHQEAYKANEKAVKLLGHKEAYDPELKHRALHGMRVALLNMDRPFQAVKLATDPASLVKMKEELQVAQELIPEVYATLGQAYSKSGAFYKAAAIQEEALKAYEGFPSSLTSEIGIGISLINLGSTLCGLGDFETGHSYHKMAALKLGKLLKENPQNSGVRLYLAIAFSHMTQSTYYTQNIEAAISIYQQTLGRLVQSDPTSKIVKSQAMLSLSLMHGNEKKHDKAIQLMLSSLSELPPTLPSSNLYLGQIYYHLSECYHEQENYQIATTYLHKAADIFQELGSGHQKYLAKTKLLLSRNFAATNDWGKALEYLEQASSIYGPRFQQAISLDSSLLSTHDWTPMIADVLSHKANLTLALPGQYFDSELERIQIAHSCYALALNLIKKNRFSYSKSARLNIRQKKHYFYEGAISTAFQLYQITSDSTYLLKAWKAMEESRGIELLESIKNSEVKNSLRFPGSPFEEEADLSHQIITLQRTEFDLQQDPNRDSLLLDDVQNELFSAKRRRKQLRKEIRLKYPAYHRQKFGLETLSIPDLQAAMPQNSVVLEYLYGEKELFIFTIGNSFYDLRSVPIDSTFEIAIEKFLQFFQPENQVYTLPGQAQANFLSYTRNGHLLFQKLLQPSLASLSKQPEQLILVPDGPLTNLPFDALLSSKFSNTAGMPYHELPYLIRDHTISYAWSSTILFAKEPGSKARKGNGGLVAFAPSYSPNLSWASDRSAQDTTEVDSFAWAMQRSEVQGGALMPLRHNLDEAKAVTAEFNGQAFVDTFATEPTFRRVAPEARILHIAAHSILNEKNPNFSNIALSPSDESSSSSNGYLDVNEIYALPLHTELAVLTICHSGVGKFMRGEGAMSIARAFRSAGCRSIVASQWAIDDQTSMEVILRFYRNLENGLSAASALRQAKLDQLAEGGTAKAHPYYWAPLTLIGLNKKVKLDAESPTWRYYLLAMVLGLATVFLVGRRWNLKP